MTTLLKSPSKKKIDSKGYTRKKGPEMREKLPDRYSHLPYKQGRFFQLNNLVTLLDLVKTNRFEDAIKISFDDEKIFLEKHKNSSESQIEKVTEGLRKEMNKLSIS